MKKLFITIIALFCYNAHAWTEDVEFKSRIGFGIFAEDFKTTSKLECYTIVANTDQYTVGTENSVSDYGRFKTTLGGDIIYKDLSLYFTNFVYSDLGKKAFSPNLIEFYSGVKYQLSSKIALNYQHLCIHPVSVDKKEFSAKLYGGYDLIEITFNY